MKSNLSKQPFCRSISIENLANPYSCYRVIKDKSGQPVDAIIVDVNSECEKMLGRKRGELIGRRITELLSEERMIEWIEFYKKFESSEKKTAHSFYSEFAGHWFNTNIFSDEEGYVNVIYYDVSDIYRANMKISHTEEKYRAIVENSPDIFIRFDKNFRHIFVNSAVFKCTGLEPDAFTGRTHRELGFPEHLCDYWESRIKTVFDNKESIREVFDFKGTCLDWRLIPEFNSNGDVEAVLSISRDITEFVKNGMALEESEERYRLLLESIPDTVAIIDYDYRFTVINDVKADLLLKSKEQLIGAEVTKACPGLNGTPFIEACRRVMTTRLPETAIVDIYLPNGRHRWYEDRIFPVPEGIIVIGSDITERKTAEEMLRDSEEKYRNLIEQSIDGIMLIDEKGRLVEFNNGIEKITGLNREQVIGHPSIDVLFQVMPEEFKTPERCAKLKQISEQYHKPENHNHEGKIFEGVVERPDGEKRYIQDLSYRFKTNNGFYTCCMTRDVTELKRLLELRKTAEESERKLKEALELDRLRTEFFANLSHELRTPLNIIFSSIQLINSYLKEEVKHSENRELLSRNIKAAMQNCYRLLRLINNLIDVTKIDAGFYELNPLNCNIIEVIEDITLSIVEYTKAKDIELTFDTDVEEKIVACDPDIMERIMLNLLSNAIKFSCNGSRILVNVSDGEEYITISVEDTGIGIPRDKLKLIFDRFTQVDKSLTRNHEGSGIGLSLVKSLVEIHGGRIWVQSELGKGTIFFIQIPVKEPNSESRNIQDKYINAQNSRVEKINIEFSDIYM